MKILTDTKKTGADINKSALSAFPSFEIEKNLIIDGSQLIAGVDEAGRGALAGPLSVGMVIFPREFIETFTDDLLPVKDSKKLTHTRRVHALEYIKKHALYFCHVFIDNTIIDEININRATERALVQLYEEAPVKPDAVIMDGSFKFNLPVPYLSVKKGDALSISIAAASIVAKVMRDEYMDAIDAEYSVYGFKKNKGYGTEIHRKAIAQSGYCDIHRKSYEPVKSMYLGEMGLIKHLFDYEGTPE